MFRMKTYAHFVLAVMCLTVPAEIMAQDAVLVVVSNNTSRAASDLHLNFTGGGGVLYADPMAVYAPGCPVPGVLSNPPAVSNRVDIDWGTACVQPTNFVAVLVTTPNGPLNYTSGYWTLNGANIGNIQPGDISVQRVALPSGPIGGPGSFGAYKVQVRYRPCGPGVYTPWFNPWPFTCWFRRCCFPAGFVCEFRIIYCPFSTPFARFWEILPWRPITPWVKGGKTGPIWFWVRLTYPPPPNQPVIKGPIPDLPLDTSYEEAPPMINLLDVRYSDDGGITYRQGADFTSAFYNMNLQLSNLITTADDPDSFKATLAYLAPKYWGAAGTLTPLINEALLVLDSEVSNEEAVIMETVVTELTSIQRSLALISLQFNDGTVTDSTPYRAISTSLINLAGTLQTVEPVARFGNAADNLISMADGLNASAEMVEIGLEGVCEQDFFLWGLMNRFAPMLSQFAGATMSHTRINLDLGDHQWFPSDVGHGTRYKVQDRASGEILDEGIAPISDLFSFDVQIQEVDKKICVWYKLPTHLSKVIAFSATDGGVVNGGTPVAGDVNGDDCINDLDLEQVMSDLGQGGADAEMVPSSDVNFDGVVDDIDLSIVQAGLGKCGQELAVSSIPGEVKPLSTRRSTIEP